MILQADTQELFKATACAVEIALIFVPKKPLSRECKFMTQDEKEILNNRIIKRATGIHRYISPEKRNRIEKLLCALFNVPLPLPISNDFLRVQDEYLQKE